MREPKYARAHRNESNTDCGHFQVLEAGELGLNPLDNFSQSHQSNKPIESIEACQSDKFLILERVSIFNE